jgi:hypothetical protein
MCSGIMTQARMRRAGRTHVGVVRVGLGLDQRRDHVGMALVCSVVQGGHALRGGCAGTVLVSEGMRSGVQTVTVRQAGRYIYTYIRQTEMQTDRVTETETETSVDRVEDKHRQTQAGRQAGRQACRHANVQTCRQRQAGGQTEIDSLYLAESVTERGVGRVGGRVLGALGGQRKG